MAFPGGATREERSGTVLLGGGDQPWTLVRVSLWDRVRAHLRSLPLDRQLAAGEPTSADRARAVRAAMLVAPAKRRQLAVGWQDILDRELAGRGAGPVIASGRQSAIPVRRSQVLAAADEIRALVAALRAGRYVPPRGVAIAHLLLTDGAGPLYNPANRLDLAQEIRTALRHLDPAVQGADG